MARVTLPDFRETNEDGSLAPATYTQNAPFEVADTDEVLLAYYQGEGALVERGVHVVARGAMEFDGEKYVEVVEQVAPIEQLPDGEVEVLNLGEQEHPGFGEPLDRVEHPADGTWSPEIGSVEAPKSKRP